MPTLFDDKNCETITVVKNGVESEKKIDDEKNT